MDLFVLLSTDRWGEDARVEAVFDTRTEADAFARAETSRTHAVAEAQRNLSAARMYVLYESVLGSGEARSVVGYAAPELSDRVTSFADRSDHYG
jgi:hypothetical protein